MPKALYCLIVSLCVTCTAIAKTAPDDPEFIKEHLLKTSYDLDTTAKAVVLFESIVYKIVPDNKGDEYIEGKVRRIIKILDRSKISEGDVRVLIASSEAHYGGITKVNAATFNLVNGEVVKQIMPDRSIQIEKEGNRAIIGKFSLPAVVPGSIIDYTYETKEEVSGNIATWYIQEDLPKLYTELFVGYPGSIKLGLLSQNTPAFVELKEDKTDNIADAYYTPLINPTPHYYGRKWVRRNIDALKYEPFVHNINNYAERVEIQIAGWQYVTFNAANMRAYSSSGSTLWADYNQKLLETKELFGQLEKTDYKLARKLVDRFKIDAPDQLTLASRIYTYIRDSFVYREEGIFGTLRELDWVFKNKLGNQWDLQLALIVLLRQAGIKAAPVLISTQHNLRLLEETPVLDRIDRMVTRVKIDDKIHYLDPSDKNYPFAYIPPQYYNGFAWMVRDSGYGVQMLPSEFKEKLAIQVKVTSAEADNYIVSVTEIFGKNGAYLKRKAWQKDSLSIKKKILDEIKGWPLQAKLEEYHVSNLNKPDENLILEYAIKINWADVMNLFFTPSLYNYYVENPFKANSRYNPVEFPYAFDINYSLSFQLPDQYGAENIPSSVIHKIDDNNLYKYLIQYNQESKQLMLNTRLNLQNAYFDVQQYPVLKDFFEKIIEIQQKAILIKKIS